PTTRSVRLTPGQFSLTIDGKKVPIAPDSPGVVSASMRETAWNSRPSVEASGSVNDAGVIVGRRNPTTGIPDLDGRNRGPAPPRAPGPENRSGQPVQKPVDINQA